MKIISHDAHMDAFTYRHAELAREALSLSTLADAVGPRARPAPWAPRCVNPPISWPRTARRRETYEGSVAGEETS